MRSILLILCVLIFISEISSEPYIATILGLGQASSINNKGQVAGTSSGNAFLWQSGNMTYLGTLGGANSYATAIDNNGYVVGSADTSSGARSAFLWRSQQEGMVNLGGFSATGINDNGYVVGYSKATGQDKAFLWTPTLGLVDLFPGVASSQALAVNKRMVRHRCNLLL